ncbi:MAG TPA: dTDP-4-dehydrorhamnose 3,5-epimerase [Vicinamibacterales bacterium]
MRVITTEIPGVIIVEPDVHRDARGYFLETFHAAKYAAAGIPEVFLQDNHSCSVQNTLRGLHLQVRKPQGKLVRVVQGDIWDVAVDVRPGLPTFGRWTATRLTAENFRQLYVPPGCAHGFCVLSETAQVEYKCTQLYDPTDEVGIAYDDPDLAIEWPVKAPILSDRDRRHGRLVELSSRLTGAGTAHPDPTIVR